MSFTEYYGFRRALVDALEADIVGPAGGENEVIDDAPITKYIAGILYPAGADPIDFSQDVDEAEDEGEIAMPDPPVALANRRYPSSMGMTFAVDSNASPKIQVELGAARYVPVPVEPDSRRQGKWKREPLEIPPLELEGLKSES